MRRRLDLFCGAGGASYGLNQAGYEVTGVDITPQANYPFQFIQADALEFPLGEFDLIWASPVCKKFTRATNCRGTWDNHPDQVELIRDRLIEWGGTYIIENVPGAPLINPTMLCGGMFNLTTYRHRVFESNRPLIAPPHNPHTIPVRKMGRLPKSGEYIQVVGHFSGIRQAENRMGINWMTRDELAQAIPPAYSKYLGEQL